MRAPRAGRRPTRRPPLLLPLGGKLGREAGPKAWTPRVATANQPDLVAGLERLLLERYAPAWIVINSQGEAVYFSPRTGRYLQPQGEPQDGFGASP